MSFLVGFRTCHVEIIRSLSESFSSYYIDTYRIVHHQPYVIRNQGRSFSSRSKDQALFPSRYILTKPSSALRFDITQNFSLISSLFSSSCGGTTCTSCCLVILLSDVPKRRLYHRVLNCTSVMISVRLYSLKYYTPSNVGMEEPRVMIEHTLTPRAETLDQRIFCCSVAAI